MVVMTAGSEKTIIAVAEAGSGSAKVTEYPVPSFDQSRIVDSNGAGDAFAGAFMAKIVQGATLAEAVDAGHWLAQLGLQNLGAQ